MATREQVATLRYFRWEEFRHPDLLDYQLLVALDNIRSGYGFPLVITSDGRTPEENAAAVGSSPTSLHLSGRAVDFRYPPTAAHLWNLLRTITEVLRGRAVELRLVSSTTDHHIHLGLLPDGQASRLAVATE